jgi:hypothetical protein
MEIGMTEEDEAFNEIERQAKQRKEAVKVAVESNFFKSLENSPLKDREDKAYERGFIDGMQKQLQSDVTRIMEGGTRNLVIEEVAQHIEKLKGFGQDTVSSLAIYIREMKQ